MASSQALVPVTAPAMTRARLQVVVVLVLGALVLAGSALTVRSFLTRDQNPLRLSTMTGPGPFAVGQPVRTTMGVVTVTHVERTGGPSPKDFAGANHGIQNLVPPSKAQVEVTVRITDDSPHPTTWSRAAFTLQSGAGTPSPSETSTLTGGRLGPGTTIEGSLGFVAQLDGSRLLLQMPGPAGPVAVDLGRTDFRAPQPADEGHH